MPFATNQYGSMNWKLNTSNSGKFQEFRTLFAEFGVNLEVSFMDLKEIDADSIKVIAHKASQLGENVIVEDTSLDIEGASVGIHVRWLLDHLSDYVGRKAEWIALLAFRHGQEILIYKGSIEGTIVLPKGDLGFGFDPVFLPEGSRKTLAEFKPSAVNARAKAVEAFIKGNVYAKHPLIENWTGPWQES